MEESQESKVVIRSKADVTKLIDDLEIHMLLSQAKASGVPLRAIAYDRKKDTPLTVGKKLLKLYITDLFPNGNVRVLNSGFKVTMTARQHDVISLVFSSARRKDKEMLVALEGFAQLVSESETVIRSIFNSTQVEVSDNSSTALFKASNTNLSGRHGSIYSYVYLLMQCATQMKEALDKLTMALERRDEIMAAARKAKEEKERKEAEERRWASSRILFNISGGEVGSEQVEGVSPVEGITHEVQTATLEPVVDGEATETEDEDDGEEEAEVERAPVVEWEEMENGIRVAEERLVVRDANMDEMARFRAELRRQGLA